jgi:SAM-dependent methyltransferase
MAAYASWKRYESAERWTSYYTQVNEVLAFEPERVLEIGVGNGMVSDALKRQGLAVTTLDIDATLQPDLVGSVEAIPVADGAFDVALCAEVLEHLPFEKFETCVRELLRVSRKGVVLSLPHWGYTLRCVADVPLLPPLRWAWKLPTSTVLAQGGVHEWEIGRTGYPPARIRSVIERFATIEKEWLSPWMPYHRFFCLHPKHV